MLRPTSINNKKLFGFSIADLNYSQIVETVCKENLNETPKILFTMNLDHVVKMRKIEDFNDSYSNADYITIDGFPVYFYARWKGVNVPERVTGADLLPKILDGIDGMSKRLFFVVSDENTSTELSKFLENKNIINYSIVVPPFGFELNKEYSYELAQNIKKFKTTHLFMCVGAPKSEVWLIRNKYAIGGCWAFSFGMAVNFLVGTVSRAPRVFRYCYLEWFWRFLKEPKRLYKRYFIESWSFLLSVYEDYNK